MKKFEVRYVYGFFDSCGIARFGIHMAIIEHRTLHALAKKIMYEDGFEHTTGVVPIWVMPGAVLEILECQP